MKNKTHTFFTFTLKLQSRMLLSPGYFGKRKLTLFYDDPWLKGRSVAGGEKIVFLKAVKSVFIRTISSFPEVSNSRYDSCLRTQVFLLNHESFPQRTNSCDRYKDGYLVGRAGPGNGPAQESPITSSSFFGFSVLSTVSTTSNNLAAFS